MRFLESGHGKPCDAHSLRLPLIVFAAMMAMVPVAMMADDAIRDIVLSRPVPGIHGLMRQLTQLGEVRLLLPLSLALWGWGAWRRRAAFEKAGFLGFVSLAFSSVTVHGLKHLFGRARPTMAEGASFWQGPSLQVGYDAFPSAHAAAAFAMAAILSFVYPRWRWIWYLAGVMVAISRIYIDVHFASDVLAGAAVGFLLSRLIIHLTERRAAAASG